ncbi:MAG: hypothetical protein HY447_02810 [Candidatus Omnitrophica bacterium]|nr:hypothetical protein [Candidatus Omnitrophota bacterium]
MADDENPPEPEEDSSSDGHTLPPDMLGWDPEGNPWLWTPEMEKAGFTPPWKWGPVTPIDPDPDPEGAEEDWEEFWERWQRQGREETVPMPEGLDGPGRWASTEAPKEPEETIYTDPGDKPPSFDPDAKIDVTPLGPNGSDIHVDPKDIPPLPPDEHIYTDPNSGKKKGKDPEPVGGFLDPQEKGPDRLAMLNPASKPSVSALAPPVGEMASAFAAADAIRGHIFNRFETPHNAVPDMRSLQDTSQGVQADQGSSSAKAPCDLEK